MPQISPMYWIVIIMALMVLLMSIKSNMPALPWKQLSISKLVPKSKSIKW